ncbi:hypothetical protein THRCLA_00643, partial [Thraustotheca clavata]
MFEYKRIASNANVAAFLRSFGSERSRWNELIEATLLYGIHCLSQNYSLHTLTVDQVQDITRATLKQSTHYYASGGRKGVETCTKRAMALKPSSSWRQGSSEDVPHVVQEPIQEKIPTKAPESVREMDIYSNLLGKKWMNAAWDSFVATTGYPSIEIDPSHEEFAGAYKKLVKYVPPPELSIAPRTFLDFVRNAIVQAMQQPEPIPPTTYTPNPIKVDSPKATDTPKTKNIPRSITKESLHHTKDEVNAQKKPGRRPPTPKTQVPSKVKQQLDANKAQVLRVRKNNTQRMHEALAKHRLELYEERTKESASPKTPTSLVAQSPGAKSLEIADLFTQNNLFQSVPATASDEPIVPDPSLQFELYGDKEARMADEGCRVPLSDRYRKAKDALKSREHDFKGWLGDYGPAHTRTVVPGDWSELDDADTLWLQQRRKTVSLDMSVHELLGGKQSGDLPPYEWNLDIIDQENKPQAPPPPSVLLDPVADVDPAFEWL